MSEQRASSKKNHFVIRSKLAISFAKNAAMSETMY